MAGTQAVAAAPWLMIGGAAIALFGFSSLLSSTTGDDRGGLAKVTTIIGVAFFLLGLYLDYRWGSYW